MGQSVENNQLKYQRGFSYSTTTIIKLYTNTVILQFYYKESSGLHHIQFSETLRNIYHIWQAESGKIYTSYLTLSWRRSLSYRNQSIDIQIYKIISESISCNFTDFFYPKSTEREIGHSKVIPRALVGYLGTRALEKHLGPRALKVLEGHLGARVLKALGRSGTWALEGHLGTKALGHLGTRSTQGTLLSRLPVQTDIDIFFKRKCSANTTSK